ncbi:hypothetical protein [Dactylosporangium sp. NPDC006015]|uniref:alpha/beta hydrolase n=1 Tax=Dactylosporangium sp. NPDC006015 TaxID=3154576 RepID=UPI0033AF97F9
MATRSTFARRLLRYVLVSLLAITGVGVGYVGYAAVRHARPVTLPAPDGAYPVGRAMFDWTDESRTDPLAPQPDIHRTLAVWLWYPAAPPAGARPAAYAPGAWARLHLGGLPGLGETRFDRIRGHAVQDSPVAAGRFPVVVLAPGLGFAAPQYSSLAEELASHGFLVAGVTPTYSANLTVLDGRPVTATAAGNPDAFNAEDLHAGPAQAAGDQLVAVWAADARFAAARTAALGTLDAGGPFAGHVDTARTAYIGHSFGGAAALEACHLDDRCAGAADLDGTQFGSVVHDGLDRPMMIVGSDGSCVTGACDQAGPVDTADRDTARALFAAGTGDVWCYEIRGAQHFNFSDAGVYYLAAPLRALFALGPVDGGTALRVTGTYLAAFLGRVLLDAAAPLLAAGATATPPVVARRTPR